MTFLASACLCPRFVEEDMNMNTELLDDTLDENFEKTHSEDYNESEMEEFDTEVSGDTERWTDEVVRCKPQGYKSERAQSKAVTEFRSVLISKSSSLTVG
ncbi:hypothetical protein AVEN_90026-1 [Araneus ventricosus]|uniref:Uncharacterized protein n=1 Tax=Araneus ventricosus TaxID=182803 RepID=A0A4Y2DE07_ARAVE|nr:hypothetical protein AVEN_90026-1 [Araneus ventricosus]